MVILGFYSDLLAGNNPEEKMEQVFREKTFQFQNAVNLVLDFCASQDSIPEPTLQPEINTLRNLLQKEQQKVREMFLSNLSALKDKPDDANRIEDFEVLVSNIKHKAEEIYSLYRALSAAYRSDVRTVIIKTFKKQYQFLR